MTAVADVYQPVPVKDAVDISRRRSKALVIVFSYDANHNLMHCTTYGQTPELKVSAADLGDLVMKTIGCDLSQKRPHEDFRDSKTAAENATLAGKGIDLARRIKAGMLDFELTPLVDEFLALAATTEAGQQL
jgi:hypothetical protein